MIRLTNDQAQQLITLVNDLEETVKRQGVETPPIIQQAVAVRDSVIEQANAPHHDGNLVDAMADVLNEIPPGGVLSGMKLTKLRQAILSPLELAKVREKATNLTCSGCGVDIGNGGLMTQYNGNVRCLQCMPPDNITVNCVGHGKVIPLPDPTKKRLRLLIRKSECPTCTAPKPAAPEPFVIDVPEAPPIPHWEQARLGGGIGVGRIPTPPPYRRADQVGVGPRGGVVLEGRDRNRGLRPAPWPRPRPAVAVPDPPPRFINWVNEDAPVAPAPDPAGANNLLRQMRDIERQIVQGPRVAMDIETPGDIFEGRGPGDE